MIVRPLSLFISILLVAFLIANNRAVASDEKKNRCILDSYKRYISQLVIETDRRLSTNSNQASQYAVSLADIFALGSFSKADALLTLIEPTQKECDLCWDLGPHKFCETPEDGLLKQFYDRPKAYKYLERAHLLGDIDGTVGLAALNLRGWGTPKNLSKALELALSAARKGSTDAQYMAATIYAGTSGELYFFGNLTWDLNERGGLKANYILAYMWFNVASAGGHNDASDGRRLVEKHLSADEIARAQSLSALCQESRFKNCSNGSFMDRFLLIFR